uniref:DUF7775 domain-containing protein n=1 Tax=Glossina austeni TaxID=7395 RepID=A0A1A9V190_GLOAU
MHFAEKDYHLMYLSDFEEPLHPFFANCKKQSICALITGFIFLLHTFFAFDMVLVRGPEIADEDNENYEATQPLQLYFISREVHQMLERKYSWFREFCSRRSVNRDSGQSNIVRHREHDSVGDKARLKAMISRMTVTGQRTTGSFVKRTRGTDFERRRSSALTLLKFGYTADRCPRCEKGNMFSFNLKNASQNSLARNLYDLDYYNDMSIIVNMKLRTSLAMRKVLFILDQILFNLDRNLLVN